MGEHTAISWADHTFNPWIGCTKIAPACDGCYAAHLMDTRLHRVEWGGERKRTSASNWRQPIAWDKAAAAAGTRPFVFCSSLADVFDNQVPNEWRVELFRLISDTPHLVWLLLTKRPQNIVPMVLAASGAFVPRNVALGTTIEDQKRFDLNAPALANAKLITRPLFTFWSCEPLLEPIETEGAIETVDWIITGGETDQGGHRARPSHPDAFRRLRDAAGRSGAVFHHKQNGEWVSVSEVAGPGEHFRFPDGATVRKVGKHRSGRTIDGKIHDARPRPAEHNAMPEARHG